MALRSSGTGGRTVPSEAIEGERDGDGLGGARIGLGKGDSASSDDVFERYGPDVSKEDEIMVSGRLTETGDGVLGGEDDEGEDDDSGEEGSEGPTG